MRAPAWWFVHPTGAFATSPSTALDAVSVVCASFCAMPMITIADEVTGAPAGPEWTVEVFEESVRLDELIRRRTLLEIAESGADVDPEERTRAALEGFVRNRFVVLVDDRQVTALDEKVNLHAGSRITFLKLVPLVGG
ncbi:hypothetical protein ACFY1S_03590 [Micromonospora sp. NPDC000663]|uniref:hypothetical protein n=1 Tax=Micromonospora sp. NPDC000663 TaxID=3364218 RepID=UPI0036769A63